MKTEKRGYTQSYYSPMPTKATQFWRRCVLWQIVRFILLNLKILKIVVRDHT